MKWLKKHGFTLLLVMLFITGLGLLLYPSFSNYWNNQHQSRAVMNYSAAVSELDEEEYKRIISSAEEYNQELAKTGTKGKLTDEEMARYESELNIDGTGMMGYITIPKINIMLPVYHGTDEKLLQKAIGHLEGTSLPVGGRSSHCVLSGHRGLPSARLFTDIDQLVVGDTFTLTILNETLTYEVDQIRTVLPTDFSDVQIEEGKDYCTLLTCTPYGINTHRLLVRGHRIPNPNGDGQIIADAVQLKPIYIASFVAVPIVLILIILLMAMMRSAAKKETAAEKYYREHNLKKPVVRVSADDIEAILRKQKK